MKRASMQNADEILGGTFLEVRAKLLEVAATLDRIERAENQLDAESSKLRAKLDQAIHILLSSGGDRAERLQRLFSRDYEDQWRSDFGL